MDVTINPAFVLFSAVSPLLIALVKQQGWSRQVNALVALACYVVIGIAGALLSGEELTVENATTLITIATLVGSAAYGIIWSNLGAEDDGSNGLDARLTAATSFVKD